MGVPRPGGSLYLLSRRHSCQEDDLGRAEFISAFTHVQLLRGRPRLWEELDRDNGNSEIAEC